MSEPLAPPGPEARGLTRQAVRAGTSLVALASIGHLFLLARTLVLARLLDPHEFGLMGIAFIAVTAADILSQTGFNRAIVQRRDDVRPYLDTVWVVTAARGLILTGIVFLIAPATASFFRTPEAALVLRVVSLRFILIGLCSPQWCLLERDLRMAKYSMPSLVGNFVDLAITSLLAWRLHNVWAMVFGYLAGATALAIMTYVVAPALPRLRLDLARARELRSFGKHIFRYEFISFFVQQSDRIAIGRLSDTTHLGLYTFASRLATIPALFLQIVIMRVALPAFAQIQQQPERVRDAFSRLMRLVSFTTFPVTVGMLAVAQEMIPIVFGERWTPAIGVFQILSFLTLLTALEQATAAVGSSVGRPELATRASALRVGLVALAVIPATLYAGIEGTAAVTVIAAAASTVYLLRSVMRALGATSSGYAAVFGLPAAGSVVMLASVAAIRAWAPPVPMPALLALMILIGASTYVGFTLVVDRLSGSTLTSFIAGLLRSR